MNKLDVKAESTKAIRISLEGTRFTIEQVRTLIEAINSETTEEISVVTKEEDSEE